MSARDSWHVDRRLLPLVKKLRERYPGVAVVSASLTTLDNGIRQQNIRFAAPIDRLLECGLVTYEMVVSLHDGRRRLSSRTPLGDGYTLFDGPVDGLVAPGNWDLHIFTGAAPRERERFSTLPAPLRRGFSFRPILCQFLGYARREKGNPMRGASVKPAEYREKLRKEFGHLTPAEIRVRIDRNDGIDVTQARHWLDFLAEDERDEVPELESFRSFDKLGEAEVRARLVSQWRGVTAMQARLWLAIKDKDRERARLDEDARKRAEEMALTERATLAAERSAAASEKAATASERSANFTRSAAWASAIAAIVSLVTAIWPRAS